MWFKKKELIESVEYKKLSERITKLEGDVNMLDVKLLNMQDSQKVLRTRLRKKLEEVEEVKEKDIYSGMLIPE